MVLPANTAGRHRPSQRPQPSPPTLPHTCSTIVVRDAGKLRPSHQASPPWLAAGARDRADAVVAANRHAEPPVPKGGLVDTTTNAELDGGNNKQTASTAANRIEGVNIVVERYGTAVQQ